MAAVNSPASRVRQWSPTAGATAITIKFTDSRAVGGRSREVRTNSIMIIHDGGSSDPSVYFSFTDNVGVPTDGSEWITLKGSDGYLKFDAEVSQITFIAASSTQGIRIIATFPD